MKHFKIYPEKDLLVYSPRGTLSAESVIVYIAEAINDPLFREGLTEFIDLSQIDEWEMSHGDVEKVISKDQLQNTHIKKVARTGIWAPSDIAFGMARMYQMMAETYHKNILVSRDRSEVLKYLNLTDVPT